MHYDDGKEVDMSAEMNAHAGQGFLMSYEDSCDRVPVLWIHGYPLNSALWDLQVDGLADIARLITPDLRGHGVTESTAPPYSMQMFADDCARLLDHLAIAGPVVVGGLSMGGYVALEFWRRHRPRVAGLILAATRAGADSDAGRTGRDEAAGVAIAEGVPAIAEAMLPKLLAPTAYAAEPDLVEFVRDMMLATATDGVVGALAAMRDRPDSTEDLTTIDVPTLIIHGAEDQLIPSSEAEAMQAKITGSELVLVPAAGHLPNLEQPEIFNDAVRDFLEQFYEA
jgi:pimeloyl-ACP methyl ester carboxylesterase